MIYEKIIKREDGTQYKIHVDLYMYIAIEYRIDVFYKNKGQRKWRELPRGIYDYQFRSLSLAEKKEHTRKNILRFVSENEIYEAKIEAWNLLKPKM